MTVPSGTFQAHTAIGQREDLTDMIHDISPMDTPFMSTIRRGRARQVFHEWQTDSLASAAVNSQIEGDDVSVSTASPTLRLANYCNISAKVYQVSGTLRATDTAGRRDELSYQGMKRARELKRDIETALLGTQAASSGGAATARVCAGAAAFLRTNQVKQGASATTPGTTSGAPTTAPTAGTAATFEEADLKALVKSCWDNGGNPTVIMTGSFNKQIASGFSGIGTQYRDVQPSAVMPGSIVGAADLYVSDFGTHQIVANRFAPAASVYAFDMDYWELCYLRGVTTTPLAKTGDSDKRMILAEFTLEAKNEASSGRIYTTTTS